MTITYVGRCLDCGDEWPEDEIPVICPECEGMNIIEVGDESE